MATNGLLNYPRIEEIRERVWQVKERLRLVAILEGLLAIVGISAGTLLLLLVIELALHGGSMLRWAMLVSFFVISVGAFLYFFLRPVLAGWSDEEIARHIELTFPQINNGLINSIQLTRDRHVTSPAMVNKLVEEVADSTHSLDFSHAIDTTKLKKIALATGSVLLVMGLLWAVSPHRLNNALLRILKPRETIPVMGAVRILNVEPGDATVLAGSTVNIRAAIENPGQHPCQGALYYAYEGNLEQTQALTPLDDENFSFTLADVRVPFTYRVHIAGSESPRYAISVVNPPAIKSIDLKYNYPSYTGLAPRFEENASGEVSAPVGTEVDLTLHITQALAEAHLLLDATDRLPASVTIDPTIVESRLYVTKDGTYSIHLRDKQGHQNLNPVVHTIKTIPDRPPAVTISVPGKDMSLAPGDKLQLVAQASDDFGITQAALFAYQDGQEPEEVHRWLEVGGSRDVNLPLTWTFDSKKYESGSVVTYYVQVWDNRPPALSQSGTSARFKVFIKSPEEEKEEKKESLSDWRKQLEEILKLQKETKKEAQALDAPLGPEGFKSQVASVRKVQLTIRERTIQLAEVMSTDEPGLALVRRALLGLSVHQMVIAIQATDELEKLERLAIVSVRLRPLLAAQDEIIKALEAILGVLAQIAAALLEESPDEEAFDLPADARQKLEELAQKLADFIRDQKRVLADTLDLTKTPVDDFTDDQKEKLEELAVKEDDWAKLLKEAWSDLSKVPVQDFANSSLLKELVEIYSEIEMAKDALKMEAVEMAVPHEQSGLELAEELTTHLERWLPDVPDRLKWEMEEPLAEYDVPMAELPEELQDIVGDLLEQEEDLFEDIEDISSSWADSLDKGAGWTAMDGPISNMSAQGVTGNVLPNTSEIGGRSGEGRTGKAHGEFVEESATGKGGRRTPTRVTPDDFLPGEVKDESGEPPGGATGGGKVSGAGSEGLEGPIPPELSRQMERLATRQAQIRNTAERVVADFAVLHYPPDDIEQAVADMQSVEVNLRSGRYQNVLRKKEVLLKGLAKTKMFLEGEVLITRDRSRALPGYLQDEVLDSMAAPAPKGYEDLLKHYYRALSETR